MKKQFDLYEELKKSGFAEVSDTTLEKEYEKEVEVAFYGKMKSTYKVQVTFNGDKKVATAQYFIGGSKRADKVKTHLNEKRALNAIRATVENHGFEF